MRVDPTVAYSPYLTRRRTIDCHQVVAIIELSIGIVFVSEHPVCMMHCHSINFKEEVMGAAGKSNEGDDNNNEKKYHYL